MKTFKQNLILILIIFVVLSGCVGGQEKARKPSEDFSRGLQLVEDASSSIGYAVAEDGSSVEIVSSFQKDDGRTGLRYLRINSRTEIVVNKELNYDFGIYARTPWIFSDGDVIQLIWASRSNTQEGWQLWYARLNKEGNLTADPIWVSDGSAGIRDYGLISDQQNGAWVYWEERTPERIMITRISGSGQISDAPRVLIEKGSDPSIRIGESGEYWIAWRDDSVLYFDRLDIHQNLPLAGEELIDLKVNLGNTLEGPVLGLSDQYAYVFWSVLRQTGMLAGTAVTEYVAFPVNSPEQLRRQNVSIYPDDKERYQPYQGEFKLSSLIPPPPENYLSTDYVFSPQTSSGPGPVVLSVAATQLNRLDSYIQVAVGIFEDGKLIGYTLATDTTQISQDAVIEVDSNGFFHILWREGAAGEEIFYASTSPEVKDSLDKVVISDLPTLLFSGGLEALTGILLFPFAFPWMALGFLIMIVWRLIQNDENITMSWSIIITIIALVSFQASKLLFLPDILLYVPFSAWLDIPAGVGSVLIYLVPILIFGIGILSAEIRRRKQEDPPSSLSYFLMVVLVDTVITLGIYGVIFLGEY